MKYFEDELSKYYYKKGMSFNKDSEKNILKYAVAANLYMNGLMNIYDKITDAFAKGIFSVTICFEDSIKETQVEEAEKNVLFQLEKIRQAIENKILNKDNIPLIFIRVRNMNQFKKFTNIIKKDEAKLICGFVFPKFDIENAREYLSYTKFASEKLDTKFYAMPILESEGIIYKETRVRHLEFVKEVLKEFDDMILNIRVGGTDFSSKFGLRRSVSTSIYDIRVVCDCLIDIVNFFARETTNYIISAPVFEYFSDIYDSLEVKGLLNEIRLDVENGFFGKTAIHPYQIKYIKRSYIVLYENYIDAKNIVESAKFELGGVFKGECDNKMNEINPHLNWAKKILERAKVFGVLNREYSKEEFLRGQNFED